MSKRHQGLLILLLLVAGLLGACGAQPTPMPSDTPPVVSVPTRTEPATEVPAPTATAAPTETTVRATDTSVPQSPTASPVPTFGTTQAGCRLGGGLRGETAELLLRYKGHPGLVMSPSYEMAERYFPELEGWMRVMGAPSLEELEEKAERAEASGLPYEALGYGLETGETTPDAEWQDLVGSTQRAREIADRHGKLLVMGPGFRLMSQNESSYAPMAALSDVWVLQTQVLQATALGDAYRQEVEGW